jgi:molybdate transport system ATP-binding protein
VGPNGAGKSTLLSLINGDNPQAFANHIILFDRKKGSGESIWDIKRKIGFFSPELYQYFPLETGCLEAVESGFYDTIGLFRPSNEELRSIALRWMGLLGVAHLSRKTLHQVSAINQRLCLLARAFVKSPPLLILDEPCQGFNKEHVALFKELVNLICRESNMTVIYVTHYKEEIPECVTKVFRLEDGKQVE